MCMINSESSISRTHTHKHKHIRLTDTLGQMSDKKSGFFFVSSSVICPPILNFHIAIFDKLKHLSSNLSDEKMSH